MRVVVVSDIHGNLVALESVLAEAGSIDSLWNLGDTVGYGPWPNECIDLVSAQPSGLHLAGNHDLAAIGTISSATFNLAAKAAADWTGEKLGTTQKEWLERLPSQCESGDFSLAHGSPRNAVYEYITTAGIASENFRFFSTTHCMVGHTHVPMIVTEGPRNHPGQMFHPESGQRFDLSRGRAILNPGSVGQPRDGDPRAAYAVVDLERMTCTFKRVGYDVALVQKAFSETTLPVGLSHRIAIGR